MSLTDSTDGSPVTHDLGPLGHSLFTDVVLRTKTLPPSRAPLSLSLSSPQVRVETEEDRRTHAHSSPSSLPDLPSFVCLRKCTGVKWKWRRDGPFKDKGGWRGGKTSPLLLSSLSSSRNRLWCVDDSPLDPKGYGVLRVCLRWMRWRSRQTV